ncbi:hypothetical protein J2S04_001768 [Alicyclobacillus tengchongensis]|uniref:Uncharacterized protein n=1 Tax=Alicyclobacillus tolerans TaxID=90970 RepID=A0ABT9LX44_9BACL|nr:hypothetical protein [Alicyclobacillus tengchongensis]
MRLSGWKMQLPLQSIKWLQKVDCNQMPTHYVYVMKQFVDTSDHGDLVRFSFLTISIVEGFESLTIGFPQATKNSDEQRIP